MTVSTAPADPVRARYSLARCLAWTGGALIAFSFMAISLREASGVFTTLEMLALRNAGGILILVTLAVLRPELRAQLPIRRPGLHLFRNLVHFAGQFTWVQGVLLLPLATAFALEFTSPVWLALLAAPFLGERLTASRLLAIAAGFLGVLIVMRPGLATFQPAALYPLAAAIFFAITTIGTKKLTATESTFAILFWMNVIQLPLNLAGSDPAFLLKLPQASLLAVAGVCLAGLISHYCLTNAYRFGDALTVVPLDYLRLPLVALVAAILYREPLDPFVFLGAAVIIAGVTGNLWQESRPSRP
jgi:drug/metabolite transporter (DMT)-like permease